tara:strand:- start:95 stop:271 length:177 start_codon:yes stop_codon:yes gene_type:complete
MEHIGKQLKTEIESKGYSINKICEKLDKMHYNTFMARLKDGKFTHSHVLILKENRYIV